MKLSTSRFCLALFVVVGFTAAQEQQLCPDGMELISNPDYQFTTCLFQDFPDDCKNCNSIGTEGIAYVPGGIDCYTAEEQLCPTIRCCENCWEKLQNYNQCFMVEPNWMSKGGLVEDGCVLDCSRFPIGGGDPVDSPPVQPDVDTTNTDSANSGIYIQDEELIENCRNARNNMMCQLENCQECGDAGYPSLDATSLMGIEDVGSFYDCGQMEEALCPEIRCCESCDYKLSEFWFQCNVVESAKQLGRTDFSCSIDCSSYESGIPNGNSLATTSEDTTDNGDVDEVETEEEDAGILDTIDAPTSAPTNVPSVAPSEEPTFSPSSAPSSAPSFSANPSQQPSDMPSGSPTDNPSDAPSFAPSEVPSFSPSSVPSEAPSEERDMVDSIFGSSAPTMTTSMLSWNIGMLVFVVALARV